MVVSGGSVRDSVFCPARRITFFERCALRFSIQRRDSPYAQDTVRLGQVAFLEGIRNHHGLPRRQSLEYKLGEMEQRSANSCNDGVEVERGSGHPSCLPALRSGERRRREEEGTD